MANLFTMGAQIILNDQFTPRINNAERASRSFRESLFSLQGALTAVAGSMAIKASFDWLVKGNADMETYQNTLAVVMGSQEKAIETLKWAQTFAAKTPFEIPQVVKATTRMSAYGLNAQKTLGIVGDMASVMGKDLMQAVEAVADAQTGEVERLKEFGITKKMIQEQAKMLGANPINKQGQITDQKAFNAALFSLMEKRYKGGMELQSKTFIGMLSNAKDFISSAGRTLGKPLFDSLKVGLGSTLEWMNKLQSSGAIDKAANELAYVGKLIGGVFVSSYKVAKTNIDMISGKLTAFYSSHRPQIDAVGELFTKVFNGVQFAVNTYARPAIEWVRTVGLPGLVDILTTVGGGVLEVASFFNEHWTIIEPLITGIIIAFGAYWVITKAIRTATMLWTAAQWAVNAAMSANPIGLVILGIGLLIGAGILLYKNWDVVKDKAADMWVGIKNTFKSGINWAIDKINWFIEKLRLVPGFGDTPFIPKLDMSLTKAEQVQSAKSAGYTDNWAVNGSHKNGLNYVPFDGYTAELHKGESVLPRKEAEKWRDLTSHGTGFYRDGVTNIGYNQVAELHKGEAVLPKSNMLQWVQMGRQPSAVSPATAATTKAAAVGPIKSASPAAKAEKLSTQKPSVKHAALNSEMTIPSAERKWWGKVVNGLTSQQADSLTETMGAMGTSKVFTFKAIQSAYKRNINKVNVTDFANLGAYIDEVQATRGLGHNSKHMAAALSKFSGLNKVVGPVGVALNVLNIMTADDKLEAIVSTIGGVVGGAAGGAIAGAGVGALAGMGILSAPLALVGGIVGSVGGAIAGQYAAGKLYDMVRESRQVNGSHKNGLRYVPYDGYIAELHKGEMVLTATEAQGIAQVIGLPGVAGLPGMSGVAGLPGMSGVAGLPGSVDITVVSNFNDKGRTVAASDVRNIDSARTTKAPGSKVTIGKLFDSLTIHGTKDMDEEKLANVIIDKLHEKLTGAADILGSADMGVLL